MPDRLLRVSPDGRPRDWLGRLQRHADLELRLLRGHVRARVVYRDAGGEPTIELGTHTFAHGFCYEHQSFECLDKLGPIQREALNHAE